MKSAFLVFLTASAMSLGSPLKRDSADRTTINLDQCSGTPQFYSQGVLYGMSEPGTPPQSFVHEIGVNYNSAGGAQLDKTPADYSEITAFQRIQQENGVLIVKMADLWGADETTGSDFLWPGDNGDWTKWDAFVQQVISDVKSKGLANAYTTQMEIWNEPNGNFVGRPQSQFNEMWVRAIKALHTAYGPNTDTFLPVVGPGTGGSPITNESWWNDFLSYLQQNGGTDVQPDVWNWHIGGGNNDPVAPADFLPGFLAKYGLTTSHGFQNNEFASPEQQVPSYSAWYKARYQRVGFHSLRCNWAMGEGLYDNLGSLLLKSDSGEYSTTGEYQVYKYHYNMAGSPCTTTPGTNVDSYAVANQNNVTAMLGSSSFAAATVGATFDKVSTQFGSTTQINAELINIAYNNGSTVDGWTTTQTQSLSVSNDQVTFTFDVSNEEVRDAWVIRLTA